jgi:hypothetical protein
VLVLSSEHAEVTGMETRMSAHCGNGREPWELAAGRVDGQVGPTSLWGDDAVDVPDVDEDTERRWLPVLAEGSQDAWRDVRDFVARIEGAVRERLPRRCRVARFLQRVPPPTR